MIRTVVSVISVMVIFTSIAYMATPDPFSRKDRLAEDEAVFVTTCSLLQRIEQCLENVERLRELDVAPSPDILTPAVEDN